MSRLLPLLWLLSAAVFGAAALLITQPPIDGLPVSAAVAHETVVAKRMPSLAAEPANPQLPVVPQAATADSGGAEPQPIEKPRNEWAAIIGYTAVIRAEPSGSAPVVTAYPIGHALRVIERRGDFARVQDLSSGQLGWVSAASIGAFVPGYRERETPLMPLLVAQTNTAPLKAVPPKIVEPIASHDAVAATARPKAETVAVAQSLNHPPIVRASLKPQRVAQNQADGGVAALVERAFSGY
ncbi:SH3 domain-containing protein [Methyloceanibacter sp.]|uniref:SH3 domain-containing protein n=1 Tax=Methyloceanibacter sp. TaxID=1965321 RepID=UPI002D30D611|nr:SH3 domain-containing protein [Methyloceanibacter sp.]HZP09665.1 SH3 domain-containing protein [Methyloceanibacter sp.]